MGLRALVNISKQLPRLTTKGSITGRAYATGRMGVTCYLRFQTKDSTAPRLGQPTNPEQDVGKAIRAGQDVEVALFSGVSVLSPGQLTDEKVLVGKILAPLAQEEYKQHAEEVNLPLPTEPTVFYKPSTTLAPPHPHPTVIPAHTKSSNSADYESELAVVLSRPAKNISLEEAGEYILGYTAANDISSRAAQFSQSQWCYSKSFDGACPIGPVLVAPGGSGRDRLRFAEELVVRGIHFKGGRAGEGKSEGNVVQNCPVADMCFSVGQLVSFLSQGTTLPAGTVILTGTPAGVGVSAKPQNYLQDGDEFEVFVSGGVGTLVNVFEAEK